MTKKARHVSVLLHDIRSVHNVGSIFRTADAFGVAKIYISGYSPLPVDRFGRKRRDLAKVALGAEENVPWEHVEDPFDLIRSLRKEKFQIVALEQAENSVNYTKVRIGQKSLISKTLVIFGSEVEGISKSILALADTVAEIPMKGKKESLNVSVAAGIFLSRLAD
jgi:tRNA G18 (ribose-2'-O)-methylase SpoU